MSEKSEATCPKCGRAYDPSEHVVVTCPECEMSGSTACCNPGGRGCLCLKCDDYMEEEDDE